jgi:hypothetical protein
VSRIVTFTNLFPSSAMPTHGLFVYERMHRVAAASGVGWEVVAPVPEVAWLFRSGAYRRWNEVPRTEAWHGVRVQHPRYRHWPGLSQRRQATAMAAGARKTIGELVREGPIVLDAHYLWPDGVAASLLAAEFHVPFTLTARGSDLNVAAHDPGSRRRSRPRRRRRMRVARSATRSATGSRPWRGCRASASWTCATASISSASAPAMRWRRAQSSACRSRAAWCSA